MIQQVEYDPAKYGEWLLRAPKLNKVMYRKKLIWTSKAKALVISLYFIELLALAFGVFLLQFALWAGFFILFITPFLVCISLYLSILITWILLEQPRRKKTISNAKELFEKHPAIKIAVLGSYGKTTMKELIGVIVGNSKKVAMTPGNKNVSISHARWVRTLDGDEDLLVIEYGEGAPGDISNFAKNTLPNQAVVTGIAPNHLDHYKTIKALQDDIYSISKYVEPEKIYVNSDSELVKTSAFDNKFTFYGSGGTKKVKISAIELDIEGMRFDVQIGDAKKVKFHTRLVGRHLIGPLSVAISIADDLGMKIDEIKLGVSKTAPFEHRMQQQKVGDAWILDDTYNGSIEGFRAGLRLLGELNARRKVYVTPGLVDQGVETESVHLEIGKLIAEANPDKVVLMNNSATKYIVRSLKECNFAGELDIRDDPLNFYTNIDQYVAAGDLWLMQNDWTDNYA